MSYGYDARDRVVSKSWTIPVAAGLLAGVYTYTYGFDAADHATSVTYPAAGGLGAETVRANYSVRGFEASVQGDVVYESAATYTGYGVLAGRVFGGAGTVTRTTPTTMRCAG